MTKSDDDAVFRRELGEPEKVTASKQPQPAAQADGYFNPQTLKVTAFASDHNQVKASTAAWAGGLMRSCATVTTKDLKPRDVVSFKVPHEMNDVEHVGTIVDTDPHSATLSVQEHVPNEARDGWDRTGTTHVLRYSDVTHKHSTFPNLEDGDRDDTDAEEVEAKVKAAFRDYFTSPSPSRKRKGK